MENYGKNYAKKKQLENFKTRLRMIMAEKGINGTDVAKALDVNKSVVSQWMNGRNFPSNDRVEQLANYLQVSSDYLVGIEKKEEVEEKEEYKAPANIETYDEAIEFLKSLNLLRAYGGLDVNQKTEDEVLNLARTIHSVLKMQGVIK